MNSLIKISKGSGKMEGIPSINTNPLTNDYCKKCTFYKTKKTTRAGDEYPICYSVYMLQTARKNCVNTFEYNSNILSKSIIDYDYLPRFNNIKAVRFNSHGELINDTHLINLIQIVKKNPDVFFSLWTKQYKIIKNYFDDNIKPENLNLIFSNSKFDRVIEPPKYFDKSFNVIKAGPHNCIGKCADCMACYQKNNINKIVEVMKWN